MDEILSELVAGTAALGVWLFGPKDDVISSAVSDPSIKPPMKFMVEGKTYFDLGERQIYAELIGKTGTTLVMVFDNRPPLGLIRLRVRKAEAAIKQELYRGVAI